MHLRNELGASHACLGSAIVPWIRSCAPLPYCRMLQQVLGCSQAASSRQRAAVLNVQVSNGAAAAWGGAERWLRLPDFSNQLHSPPYAVLLDCDSWQACPLPLLTLSR